MTPLDRLRRGRRRLLGAVVLGAVLWAVAAAAGILALAAGLGRIVPLAPAVADSLFPVSALAGAAAAAVVLWRARAARSVARVALWIEEQQPDLRFSLVTAADRFAAMEGLPDALVAGAGRADIERLVRSAAGRSLLPAGIAAITGLLAILLAGPPSPVSAGVAATGVRGGARPDAPSRLLGLRARVDPPKYSRLPPVTLDEPSVVEALIGSGLTLGAAGSPEGITLATGGDTVPATADGGRWHGRLVMPPEPGVVTLRDRGHQRLVVLSPRVDSAPAVTLSRPAQDTVWATPPRGSLALEARATDDLGLAYGQFEYLISKGTGEDFQTVTVLGPRVRLGLAAAAPLRATVNLDTMRLATGTVLSIRALAVDANDVTGPGRGVSETRTLRVAEKPDTVSVTQVPPLPIDSTWMSQRLLNMRTDTLVRDRRKLERKTFTARSTEYSNVQENIRQRVLAVIQVLEDDGVGGSFQTETSKLLRQAEREMWEARLNLGIAHPDSALPYMRRALKILDEVRTAYRYYLRGLQRPIVVDVEKARLQANDPAAAGSATGRQRLVDAAAGLAAAIEAAARVYEGAPQAALDSLAFVQARALSTHPEVAKALESAVRALLGGASLDSALAPARRTLALPARVVAGPAEWVGAAP